MTRLCIRIAGLLILAASAPAAETPAPVPNNATATTRAINRAQLTQSAQAGQQDFEATQRGLIEASRI